MPTGMGPTDLNLPANLEGQLGALLQSYLKYGPNFQQADKSFASETANPFLAKGPSGQVLDPKQMQSDFGTNWLNSRGDVANEYESNQMTFANLLEGAGNAQSGILNMIPQLQALQKNASGGFLGSLLGGLI